MHVLLRLAAPQLVMAGVLMAAGAFASVTGGYERMLDPEVVGARLQQPAPASTMLFVRNARVALALAVGFTAAGVPTVVRLLELGSDLTAQIVAIRGAGVPVLALVAGLVPHGLLEVPAFCLAGGAGLGGARVPFQLVRRRYDRARDTVFASLVLAAMALLALAAAAVVEAWLTPAFVRRAF